MTTTPTSNSAEPAVIKVDSTYHCLDAKPITIITPGADQVERIHYPGRIELDLETCLYHGSRCSDAGLHRYTKSIVEYCLDQEVGWDLNRSALSTGIVKLIGLIDLSLKLTDKGMPIVWLYPEGLLHPKVCCNLGDVLIFLAKYTSGEIYKVPSRTKDKKIL